MDARGVHAMRSEVDTEHGYKGRGVRDLGCGEYLQAVHLVDKEVQIELHAS